MEMAELLSIYARHGDMVGYAKKRAQTRSRLLRAGMVVVAQRGVAAASVGEVAGEAGVVAGTFYNHFASREEFVAALADELGTEVRLGVEQIRAMEGDPAGRVALAVLGLVRRAATDAEFGAAFIEFVARAPGFGDWLRAATADVVAEGVARGRFTVAPGPEPTDALVGLTLEAVRSQVSGRAGPDSAPVMATLALTLLGLSSDHATLAVAAARQSFSSR